MNTIHDTGQAFEELLREFNHVSPAGDLSCFQIPRPPLAEQQAIAVHVPTEITRIDALIHHAKEEIALLKELRAATFADAVLGRVDVRPRK